MIRNIPNNLGWIDSDPSTIQVSESNLTEYNREKFVTDLAAISRGKSESSNPSLRYRLLLKEAAVDCYEDIHVEGKPGRPLEFLPVKLKLIMFSNEGKLYTLDNQFVSKIPLQQVYNYLIPFSFYDIKTNELYTNMRALLLAGVPYKYIPFNSSNEIVDFKAIKLQAPYFVFAQIRTHSRISQIASSVRVLEENEIWLPENLETKLNEHPRTTSELKRILNLFQRDSIDMVIQKLKEKWYILSVDQWQELMKNLGYKSEIWRRFPNLAIFKTWTMAGWYNDCRSWKHFFLERNAIDTYQRKAVQPETATVAFEIRKVIEETILKKV